MRDIFVVSIGTALLFAGAARAEDSMTNPFAQYLLTDEQIAAKCQHSIAEHVDVVDGKTRCERIYEDLRADAQKYQEALAAEAKAIASGELSSACEKDPNQQNCIKSGNETGAHYLAAHRHMVALVADVQEDLHHLVEAPPEPPPGGENVANNEGPPERDPASNGDDDPPPREEGGSNQGFRCRTARPATPGPRARARCWSGTRARAPGFPKAVAARLASLTRSKATATASFAASSPATTPRYGPGQGPSKPAPAKTPFSLARSQ